MTFFVHLDLRTVPEPFWFPNPRRFQNRSSAVSERFQNSSRTDPEHPMNIPGFASQNQRSGPPLTVVHPTIRKSVAGTVLDWDLVAAITNTLSVGFFLATATFGSWAVN